MRYLFRILELLVDIDLIGMDLLALVNWRYFLDFNGRTGDNLAAGKCATPSRESAVNTRTKREGVISLDLRMLSCNYARTQINFTSAEAAQPN